MQPMGTNFEAFQKFSLERKVSKANSLIPRPVQWHLYTVALVLSDIFMTGVAFRLAFGIRFEIQIPFFQLLVVPEFLYYQRLVLIITPILLIFFLMNGLYNRQYLLGGTAEYAKLFRATTYAILLVIIAGFLEPDLIIARGWLLMAWGFTFIFTALGRFTLRRVVYSLRLRGFFLTPAIIVGGNDEGRTLAEQLTSWSTSGLHLVGFVDEVVPPGAPIFRNLCSLGNVDQLDEIIARYDIGELILASSAISSRTKLLEIFKRYGVSKDVNLHMSSGLYEIITTGLTVREYAYVPLVGVNKVRLTGVDRVLKAVMDFGLALAVIVLISPFLLLIAIAIKVDSQGPIIHRRRVMGINGRQFDAFKFRTMHVNGDQILEAHPELKEELARNHKLKKDPRITRIGGFFRKYSIDELPQFFNVLRGEMSLVGPRMISPEETAKYTKFDINLLTVRPGITGLWQVSGRSDVSYEERVQMDMYYVRNWSIWLDLQLLFQTIPAALRGRGAY